MEKNTSLSNQYKPIRYNRCLKIGFEVQRRLTICFDSITIYLLCFSFRQKLNVKIQFKNTEGKIKILSVFPWLRFGHSFLPNYRLNLSFTSSPLRPLHTEESAFRNFVHIIFHCPPILPNRLFLFTLLSSAGYHNQDTNFLLNSCHPVDDNIC